MRSAARWSGPLELGRCDMNREIELKLEIDPAQAWRLAEHPLFRGEPRRQRQISVYFDTPRQKLRRHGWVLRVRQTDGKFVQTIKRVGDAAGLFDREEWEAEVTSLAPDFGAIEMTPLRELIKARQMRHLEPVCRCDIDRSTRLVRANGSRIELTYDEGVIEARGASEPVHEIELELKEGELAALLATARKLGTTIPIKLGVAAKSERGFTLASGRRKAPAVSIGADATVAEGLAAIATACLKHFRMNEPLLIEERDAEALHQLRVAIRRLRSALWLFRPVLAGPEFQTISDRLRRLTRELGAARNIDVILAAMPLNDPARSQLEEGRNRSYSKILRKLGSRNFRLFTIELLAWVHSGQWRQGKKAGGPLMRLTLKRLDRLWSRIAERGGDLRQLSAIERHRLRIDTKKLRYALEFLARPLEPAGANQKKFGKAAEGLQDSLGLLNDLATRPQLLPGAGHPARKEAARLLRAAKRHWQNLEKIGPYWREART